MTSTSQAAVITTTDAPPSIDEISVAKIRASLTSKKLSCESLVSSYLARIEKYDKSGPLPIRSIIAINPKALEDARAIDRLPATSLGPLACSPLIIKDNIDVAGMATTAGSKALNNWVSESDATQVERLRKAGAVILAKANLAEFAWTPDYSESSLGGLTRNPYDPTRTTGGSSGGTAAAVAANFGVAGLGTDTGASIRGPSALQNLVGLRPTLGASSRFGTVPISLTRDVVGPMARSVADAALIYQVTAGYDAKDTATYASRSMPAFNAERAFSENKLHGMRVGVVRQLSNRPDSAPEVAVRFEAALATMKKLGATVVDIQIPKLDTLKNIQWPNRMEADFNSYLSDHHTKLPVSSFRQLYDSGEYGNGVKDFLKHGLDVPSGQADEEYESDQEQTSALREAIVKAMDKASVSVLVYPTWTQPPRLLENLSGDGGNNNPMIAHAGLPGIMVPMGNVLDQLPTSLQIAGRPYSEEVLFGVAYDFEQATHYRTAPKMVPPAVLHTVR